MTVEARGPGATTPLVPAELPAVGGVIAAQTRLRTSIIVCTYTESRWEHLSSAIRSVLAQLRADDELVVVVDHNERLFQRAAEAFQRACVVSNLGSRGLSGARNTGISAATGEVLVFLDDDAYAEAHWLDRMLAPYQDPAVMGVGGAALPDWPRGRPRWFPPEFDWVVGCSYIGLPTALSPVRNPIGASMSFRRSAFELAGAFTEGIGRVNAVPMGCEETEFGIRLHQISPGAVVLYEPEAVVHHRVTVERTTFHYFWSRCHAEGRSKALVAANVGKDSALAAERAYIRHTLPQAIGRGLFGREALIRALVVVVGLLVTTAGYIRGIAARPVPVRAAPPLDDPGSPDTKPPTASNASGVSPATYVGSPRNGWT